MILSLTLGLGLVLGVNAQEKGDFYVGTGDISNTAWTEWSISPTVGYGITNKLMVGLNYLKLIQLLIKLLMYTQDIL